MMVPPAPNTNSCPSLLSTFPAPSSWLHPTPPDLPGHLLSSVLHPRYQVCALPAL